MITTPNHRQDGFTLTELAVVLVIVALLIGGMMIPLSAQYEVRDTAETQARLKAIDDALLGFLVANDRLPCPATAASNGQEKFAAGGSAANGACETFLGGFLPAATLGVSPTDAQGFAIDAWGNRIRYSVYADAINGVSNPFTRTEGIKQATMSAFYNTASLLVICPTATGADANGCGTGNPYLANKAPVVFFSTGKNGATGSHGADEALNLAGGKVFVSHDAAPASAANGEFDDMVRWLSLGVMLNRLVGAGRLS